MYVGCLSVEVDPMDQDVRHDPNCLSGAPRVQRHPCNGLWVDQTPADLRCWHHPVAIGLD